VVANLAVNIEIPGDCRGRGVLRKISKLLILMGRRAIFTQHEDRDLNAALEGLRDKGGTPERLCEF
jgi:hypothetical protein